MHLNSINPATTGTFWINTAILLYSSGTFFIYLLVDYLVRLLNSNLVIVWMIHHSVGLIFYSIIIYGLIKVRMEYESRVYSI